MDYISHRTLILGNQKKKKKSRGSAKLGETLLHALIPQNYCPNFHHNDGNSTHLTFCTQICINLAARYRNYD